MASLLLMPAPAAGVDSVVLIEWALAERAKYEVSDVLAVIETDKAVIEIEAEAAGILHRRLVKAGEQVDVGTPIAVLGSTSDTSEEIEALAAEAVAATAPRDSPRDEVGGPPSAVEALGPDEAKRKFSSPLARKMANGAGLTLDDLNGTGPGGRVVRRDVERAIVDRSRAEAESQVSSDPQPHPSDEEPKSAWGEGRVDAIGRLAGVRTFRDQPNSKMRTAIASRLAESQRTVPHFYLKAEPRVDALLAMREQLNGPSHPKVSLNDLMVRAVAVTHRAIPEMNVAYMGHVTRQFDYVDVSVAIATDRGLVAPAVQDADRLSVAEIAVAIEDLAARARSGTLKQSELETGTVTVTNLGMYGVAEFAAIVNPPQSAILAIGATRKALFVEGDQPAVGTVINLVLSVDHRPLDGVVAARWMAALVDLIEHPVRILA